VRVVRSARVRQLIEEGSADSGAPTAVSVRPASVLSGDVASASASAGTLASPPPSSPPPVSPLVSLQSALSRTTADAAYLRERRPYAADA
jgi:hypothetical protein